MNINCYLVIEIFLLLGLLIVLTMLPTGSWKSKEEKDDAGSSLKKKIDSHNADEIKNISSSIQADQNIEAIEYLEKKISNSINYAINRHDWYENQRKSIFQFILTGFSIVIALNGLILKSTETIASSEKYFLIFSFLLAILPVTFALWHYNHELDSDRPYRLVSDIRYWYFRYNLPEKSDNLADATTLTKAEAVLSERKIFFDRCCENFDYAKSVREDLEQIFILHVLQRYKHESLKKLRYCLVYFIVAFCLHITISSFLLL